MDPVLADGVLINLATWSPQKFGAEGPVAALNVLCGFEHLVKMLSTSAE